MRRLITLLLLVSTILSAQKYRYELTPYFGKNFMDNKYRMGDSAILGLNFDTFFHNNFGLRVGYERLLNMDVDNSDDATMNRFYFNGIARYMIPRYNLTPYLFAGFGHESCEDNDCPSVWFKDIGIGLGVGVNCNLKISPELKVVDRKRHCDKCDNFTDVVASVGATYAFGIPKTKIVKKVVRVKVPVEKIVTKEVRVEVPVQTCQIPTDFKDRCDNSYYIQIASFLLCPTCEVKIRNKKFLQKLRDSGYRYEVYEATTKDGNRVAKVLIGSYRCKRDAYAELCHIKEKFKCDAFIYSK
jgi:hypothetical protein